MASLVLLGAQYLHYLYWDLAQRESFSNWFMLPAALFALRALEPSFELDGDKKKARAWMIPGALSGIAVFGKPTYAFFGIAIVFFLLLDREALLIANSDSWPTPSGCLWESRRWCSLR